MKKLLALIALPLFVFGCQSSDDLPTRTVYITSQPEGAAIVVNNFNLGKTPLAVEFETNEFGCFVKKQSITALPQSAELFTQMLTFPAYNQASPEASAAPKEITFIMTKSPKEEGGVIKK